MYVDAARYRAGVRVEDGRFADLVRGLDEDLAAGGDGAGEFVWLGLHDPTPQELADVVETVGLHPLAVEDLHRSGQQPKVERFDDTLFVVVHSARYLDDREEVEFGEIQMFATPRTVIVVRRGAPVPLASVRRALESDPASLARGPFAVVHAVLDAVVDRYAEVLAGLDNDVSEVELDVFGDHSGGVRDSNPVERIYFLRREVLELHRALSPLLATMPGLRADPHVVGTADLHEYFRDVEDHLSRQAAALHVLRDLLADALQANATQVNLRQNADMRMISAWVAIAAVPTVLGAIYGMNFRHMPELDWRFSYPVTVGIIVVACLLLHRRFRRAGWL